ncbi:hypothetical protein [Gracilibacillus sp. YIM 98692]|uniref:hypothetical protein n=1 Tax=Gracilibacillus sp. YIM 98692 TaxID=2663532 RepID=UPI0013D266F3|nr:hypothetical protein [Gracilibacillus sp. YIM 98692]
MDYQSDVFINGKEDGIFLPTSSLIAEASSEDIYNHYAVRDVTSSATEIGADTKKSQDISTLVTIQGISGSTPTTYLSGNNLELKNVVKKHLEMNGFAVNMDSDGTNQSSTTDVSITYTEAQGKAFFTDGNLTSFLSLSEAAKTQKFKDYTKSIQDAIHEYKTEKNVWIWDRTAVSETPDETINFLVQHHVDNLYLHFNPLIKESYPYFIQKATENGMKVHALMGAPQWGLEANIPDGKHRMDLVREYNENAPADGKFIGIHFDIEPHVLDEWDQDRADAVQQWANSVQEYIQYAKEFGFTVGTDLPFWTDGPSVEPYYPGFYQKMIDMNDYVTVMAYRNTALGSNSITSLSENEVLYANSPKVEIGVELKPHYLDYVSFDDKTNLEMEKELALVRDYYKDLKAIGFKGITYHSYREWRDLTNR